MNIRIAIDESCLTKLEDALVRVERLKRDFVRAAEVDALAELVLEECREWDKITVAYQNLTEAWKSVLHFTSIFFQNSIKSFFKKIPSKSVVFTGSIFDC